MILVGYMVNFILLLSLDIVQFYSCSAVGAEDVAALLPVLYMNQTAGFTLLVIP